MVNIWVVNKMNERVFFGSQCFFLEFYVIKEEMDKKVCCFDNDGNFSFDVFLLVVYWKL